MTRFSFAVTCCVLLVACAAGSNEFKAGEEFKDGDEFKAAKSSCNPNTVRGTFRRSCSDCRFFYFNGDYAMQCTCKKTGGGTRRSEIWLPDCSSASCQVYNDEGILKCGAG
jgi:hypothetical protein